MDSLRPAAPEAPLPLTAAGACMAPSEEPAQAPASAAPSTSEAQLYCRMISLITQPAGTDHKIAVGTGQLPP
jgi:hypothetical protein